MVNLSPDLHYSLAATVAAAVGSSAGTAEGSALDRVDRACVAAVNGMAGSSDIVDIGSPDSLALGAAGADDLAFSRCLTAMRSILEGPADKRPASSRWPGLKTSLKPIVRAYRSMK